MADTLSPADKQTMVSSFLEIAVGQTADTAHQFLQATSWKLDEAIQLFYVGNDGLVATSSSFVPRAEYDAPSGDHNLSGMEEDLRDVYAGQGGGDEVRAPLPIVNESLYGDAGLDRASRAAYAQQGSSSTAAFRDFDDEMRRPGVWDVEQDSASTKENSPDNLASLYRPPFALMFQGSFEKAKVAAASENKWLLVNLQSNKEFNSHMLNRDTWGNEAVAQTIKSNFIFWQNYYNDIDLADRIYPEVVLLPLPLEREALAAYDETTEGKKICTYYKAEYLPIILVIDPITGQKMRLWSGMIHPDRLLEDLFSYMDKGPQNYLSPQKKVKEVAPSPPQNIQETRLVSNDEDEELQQALAFSMEDLVESEKSIEAEALPEKEPKPRSYLPLPDEPKAEKSLMCRIGFRLPDGRRVQRNFLLCDPLQILWSFCCSQIGEDKERAFRLAQAIPGCSKTLDYESQQTVGESGLANSMILVTWE